MADSAEPGIRPPVLDDLIVSGLFRPLAKTLTATAHAVADVVGAARDAGTDFLHRRAAGPDDDVAVHEDCTAVTRSGDVPTAPKRQGRLLQLVFPLPALSWRLLPVLVLRLMPVTPVPHGLHGFGARPHRPSEHLQSSRDEGPTCRRVLVSA